MKVRRTLFGRILFVAAGAFAAAWGGPQAEGQVIVSLQQSGADVVGTLSGQVNSLSGLTNTGPNTISGVMNSSLGLIGIGQSASINIFNGLSGPTSFGTGNLVGASSSTGQSAAVFGVSGTLYLPQSYTLGSTLSGTSTWNNTTLSALGVTPGTYTWTWAGGSFTLQAGVSSVPEPSTLTLGSVVAAVGLFAAARRRGRGRRAPRSRSFGHPE